MVLALAVVYPAVYPRGQLLAVVTVLLRRRTPAAIEQVLDTALGTTAATPMKRSAHLEDMEKTDITTMLRFLRTSEPLLMARGKVVMVV